MAREPPSRHATLGPEPTLDHSPTKPELGERLASFEPRLRLLLGHLAGRAIRARVEVSDLAQEVFLRAVDSVERLPEFEPGDAALWRFLARLARNTVIDVARSLRTRKREGAAVSLSRSDWSRVGPAASQLLAETAGPLTRLVTSERSDLLAARFEALSPEYRRVLGLRQLEGLSARETAGRMGRSETAIHSLYRRALGAWEAAIEGGASSEAARNRDSNDESRSASRPEPT